MHECSLLCCGVLLCCAECFSAVYRLAGMRAFSSSGGRASSHRPPSSAANGGPADGEWESDPRFAAMAEEHERFLIQQQQRQRQGRPDDDTANAATFDDMAEWDSAAQPALLPATLAHQPYASYGASRVLFDDEGGDEVSLDVVLAGIAAGRDVELLSSGLSLAEIDRQRQHQYYQQQPHYAVEEQLDSSMLDSVLKALEEEEDELLDEASSHSQTAQALPPPQPHQVCTQPHTRSALRLAVNSSVAADHTPQRPLRTYISLSHASCATPATPPMPHAAAHCACRVCECRRVTHQPVPQVRHPVAATE